jgi:hypothetical protein
MSCAAARATTDVWPGTAMVRWAKSLVAAGTVSSAILGFASCAACAPRTPLASRRAVTVADTIEMVRVAGDSHYYDGRPPSLPLAYFSPDGDQFVVVLRKGNLGTNANDYSMVLFQTSKAFDSPTPDLLLRMSSVSNFDAIRQIEWVDRDTIAFLGENGPASAQVYTFDLPTRRLEKRTQHASGVREYRVRANGREVLFLADGTSRKENLEPVPARDAMVITTETLAGILAHATAVTPSLREVFRQRRNESESKSTASELPEEKGKEAARQQIEIVEEEGMNLPQRLFAVDARTRRKALLLDLNPQFAQLNLAHVEWVDWKGTDGKATTNGGGLYLPPNYEPGKRYPLVIQTHRFNKDQFMIDGPWSSGYSAQALAAKGLMVLEVNHAIGYAEREDTPEEAPAEMAMYEGAIDFLDSAGRIDRSRVGIFGFSRTVYHVAYTLTHSGYAFAAAALEDGIDGGYLQYLDFPWIAKYLELLNGGPPSGNTLASWAKNAPGFNLDKVRAPVHIAAHGYAGALQQWEWFSGLKLLRKPVEMIVFPNPGMGEHLLKKPRERLASQESVVDWFSYWLQDKEDADPAKKPQYDRWGGLRKQRAGESTSRESRPEIGDTRKARHSGWGSASQ